MPPSPVNGRPLNVVIPVFNEVRTLPSILERVAASPVVGTMIVVDDGSTDGSRELLTTLESPDPEVRLEAMYQDRNRGKGAAVRRGFTAATGPVTIIQDADLEYDPSEYAKVIRPILEGEADVSLGSRYLGQGWGKAPAHTLGNHALTFLMNLLAGTHWSDAHTCYKAFRTDLLRSLHLTRNGFDFDTELIMKLARLGVRFREVPIRYVPRSRHEGKKISWRDAVECLSVAASISLF